MVKKFALAASLAFTLSPFSAHAQTSAILTPNPPVAVPGTDGGFDYMTADPSNGFIFASHPGAKELVVLNTKDNTAQQIDLQTTVNGVAVDAVDDKFFTAGGGGKLFDLNRETLKQQGETDLPGPGDGILFVPDNDTLYIDNDDGTKIWAVNGKSDQITSTITIDGAPEYMAYDTATKRLFQNIKAKDEIQVIDTTSNTVTASWPTTPATKPHGLVFDPVSNRLYSAGRPNILAVIDAASGKIVQTLPLASNTDQIAFDSKLRRIYAPGGGFITVIGVGNDGTAAVLGQVTVPAKDHTLAVDPNTGNVWISYTDGTTSYLQSFVPSAN